MFKNLKRKILDVCYYISWFLLILVISIFIVYYVMLRADEFITIESVRSNYILCVVTLFAGLSALKAGHWAYVSATRKTSLHEKNEKEKRKAYSLRMKLVIEDLLQYATNENRLVGRTCPFPSEIKAENWENHALLKEQEINDVYHLYRLLCGMLDINRIPGSPEKIFWPDPDSQEEKDLKEICTRLDKSLKQD